MLKPKPPVPQKVIVFADRIFKGNSVEMKLIGWILIQSNECPYAKKRLGHTEHHQGHTHREEGPCEDTERRQLSASPGERLLKKTNL